MRQTSTPSGVRKDGTRCVPIRPQALRACKKNAGAFFQPSPNAKRSARGSLAHRASQTEKHPVWGAFLFGLPERIRTFDLQSRSLTRYPAVPRVGMKLYLIIIAYLWEKCKPFLKKSRAARSLFARLFPTKDPPRRGLDPCGKLSLYLWISPQVSRKVSHNLWKTLWTSRPKS